MTRILLVLVAVVSIAAPVSAQSDSSPLAAARDLYASARYDEALALLNGLRPGSSDRKSVEQYRSLCLLALGRATEAETAIAAVVTADPTYRPGESDASPRVRATFTEVRRRLLPEIATARYQAAKGSYDRKEWAAAQQQFTLVLSLIDDPDTAGRLGDLRVLTVGFLELSARAAAPPPPPPPVPQGPIPGRVYTSDDASVAAPTVLRQDIPNVPQTLMGMAKPRGLLEVVIDEQGRVINMAVRASIHPSYDNILLAAARDWKYKPATFDGQPVRFRRLIQIAIKK
jgi:TonB family protein